MQLPPLALASCRLDEALRLLDRMLIRTIEAGAPSSAQWEATRNDSRIGPGGSVAQWGTTKNDTRTGPDLFSGRGEGGEGTVSTPPPPPPSALRVSSAGKRARLDPSPAAVTDATEREVGAVDTTSPVATEKGAKTSSPPGILKTPPAPGSAPPGAAEVAVTVAVHGGRREERELWDPRLPLPRADAVSFGTVIDGCSRARDSDAAVSLLAYMRREWLEETPGRATAAVAWESGGSGGGCGGDVSSSGGRSGCVGRSDGGISCSGSGGDIRISKRSGSSISGISGRGSGITGSSSGSSRGDDINVSGDDVKNAAGARSAPRGGGAALGAPHDETALARARSGAHARHAPLPPPPNVYCVTAAITACGRAGNPAQAVTLLHEAVADEESYLDRSRVGRAGAAAVAQGAGMQRARAGEGGAGVGGEIRSREREIWGGGGDEGGRLGAGVGGEGQLRRAGAGALRPAYNAAIDACVRAGRHEEARELVEDMRDRGMAPGREVFNSLLGACSDSSEVSE